MLISKDILSNTFISLKAYFMCFYKLKKDNYESCLNITAIIIILFYCSIIDYFFSTGTAYLSPVSLTSLRAKLAG